LLVSRLLAKGCAARCFGAFRSFALMGMKVIPEWQYYNNNLWRK